MISSFFKFLEKKAGKRPPFEYKLVYAPETIEKEELYYRGDIDLFESKIYELPEGLHVTGNLNLGFTLIEELPNNLTVTGTLYLRNTNISEFPQNLHIGNNLMVINTPLAKSCNYLANTVKEKLKQHNGSVGGYISAGVHFGGQE